jgi:hypothetical protein
MYDWNVDGMCLGTGGSGVPEAQTVPAAQETPGEAQDIAETVQDIAGEALVAQQAVGKLKGKVE